MLNCFRFSTTAKAAVLNVANRLTNNVDDDEMVNGINVDELSFKLSSIVNKRRRRQ